MKLKLPNDKEIILDINLSIEEKKKIVNNILKEYEKYFYKTWDVQKTKITLDILGSYLCHKKGKRDDEILTRKRFGQMAYGGSKTIPFSCLTNEQQNLLGIIEFNDEEED